jgi:hypothetical protein
MIRLTSLISPQILGLSAHSPTVQKQYIREADASEQNNPDNNNPSEPTPSNKPTPPKSSNSAKPPTGLPDENDVAQNLNNLNSANQGTNYSLASDPGVIALLKLAMESYKEDNKTSSVASALKTAFNLNSSNVADFISANQQYITNIPNLDSIFNQLSNMVPKDNSGEQLNENTRFKRNKLNNRKNKNNLYL